MSTEHALPFPSLPCVCLCLLLWLWLWLWRRRNHFTINQNAAFEEYWKEATAGSELAAKIKLDT